MRALTLQIEVEYDEEAMHGDDQVSIDWFYDDVIDGKLYLYSEEIGDMIGKVTKLRLSKGNV